jgi:hypothetical protein
MTLWSDITEEDEEELMTDTKAERLERNPESEI